MNCLIATRNKVSNFFKLEERNTNIVTELRAGIVTFLTMAYILAVNAAILADSGGTCKFVDPFDLTADELACKENLKIDLIYATAISAGVSTLLMGLTANLPLALAPGMGLNAYFTFDVVGFHGTGSVSYRNALFATFIEGFIFLALSFTGLRFKMMNMIPKHIKLSMTAGIGLFLAHIGLQSAEGIGLVTSHSATLVTLGGCDLDKQVCSFVDGIYGSVCYCPEGTMEGATTWLGIAGFALMSLLMIYKVKGAMFFAIMSVTILSWFRNTAVSYFPNNETGDDRYNYFSKVVDFHSFSDTPGALFKDVNLEKWDIWVALITFLYVDMLDTAGTLFSMAEFMKVLNDDGSFSGQTAAFCSDAVGTIIGSLLGTSSVTTYIESGSGIEEGGRTGLTAVTASFFFFLSLIFAPILASIPPWATGPALILIGSLMIKTVLKIDWNNMRVAIPSFVTIVVMPLTFSIAYGIIAGLCTNLFIFSFDKFIGLFKYCPCKKSENEEEEEVVGEEEIENEVV